MIKDLMSKIIVDKNWKGKRQECEAFKINNSRIHE